MVNPGKGNQNRRDFLKQSGALLVGGILAGCTSGGAANLFTRRKNQRPRYLIATQSLYWKKQDLSSLGSARHVHLHGLAEVDLQGNYTVVTSVNDDGTDLRRIVLPNLYHCAVRAPDGAAYLVGNHRPSFLVRLDPHTLEVDRAMSAPSNGDVRNFGGHAVVLPGGDHVAFTMNQTQRGKYDSISVRDANTLREVARYSTYGFQAHEIRLTPDAKYFVCGHYGSYLGQGPYKELGIYSQKGAYGVNRNPEYVYPSSVTLVHARSGERFRLLSDRDSGQEGHADSDDNYDVYLPNVPATMRTRPGLESHPRFKEGEYAAKDNGEFAVTDQGMGITLRFDPKFREMIVPVRSNLQLLITDSVTKKMRKIDLAEQITKGLEWAVPEEDLVSGLDFHPDGRHYVLSTSKGFLAVERGTHKLNPAMSFPLPLLVHSHLCIA